MHKKVALYSLIWPFIAIIWLHIPIVNIPMVFLSMPLWDIAPFVSQTNDYVEWYFFGPIIKSFYAFIVFGLYYWAVGIPVYLIIWWKKRDKCI